MPTITIAKMIDQKWSPRAIPTIAANVTTRLTAGTRITTLYRRPRAMPAKTLITANSNIQVGNTQKSETSVMQNAVRHGPGRATKCRRPATIAGTRSDFVVEPSKSRPTTGEHGAHMTDMRFLLSQLCIGRHDTPTWSAFSLGLGACRHRQCSTVTPF